MKYIVLVFLIFLSGCIEQHKWQITCDSGYKTPISSYTGINDGIISYRINKNSTWYRKLIPGEVCVDKKVMPQ